VTTRPFPWQEGARDRPVLRVVAGGEPTAEELAALVLAVTAASAARPGGGTTARDGRRRGGWADRSAGLRRPLRAGADGWRASAR
jgi:hypothetical protein